MKSTGPFLFCVVLSVIFYNYISVGIPDQFVLKGAHRNLILTISPSLEMTVEFWTSLWVQFLQSFTWEYMIRRYVFDWSLRAVIWWLPGCSLLCFLVNSGFSKLDTISLSSTFPFSFPTYSSRGRPKKTVLQQQPTCRVNIFPWTSFSWFLNLFWFSLEMAATFPDK